jgi:hypothetical protein
VFSLEKKKQRIKMKKSIFIGAIALAAAGAVQATIISTYEFSTNETFSTLPGVSATDAATSGTATRDPSVTGGNFSVPLNDGLYGTGFGNNIGNQNTEAAAIVRYKIDLGESVEIGAINSYAYGDLGDRSKQNFSLYGSTAETTSWDETDATTWTLIASVDTKGVVDTESYGATSIYDDGGGALGTYQELMWVTGYANIATNGKYEGTIYKEFDVIAIPEPATLGLVTAFGMGMLFVRRRLML